MKPSIHPYDTAQLGPLRQVATQIPALRAAIGDIARFRLVIDANFVVQELIHRIRCPHHGASAFEELVKATVIDVFAPRWLEMEITTSAIPKAAKRSKVSELELRARWAQFKPLLKWDETLAKPEPSATEFCDPKDPPYVLLQHKMNADGILTKDAHIARMGGHPLSFDFILSTRNYARSAVTTVSICVMGIVIPTATVALIVDLLRRLTRLFSALPDPIKALIILGAAVALMHPDSRRWIADRCTDAYSAMQPTLNGLAQLITTLANTNAEAKSRASFHLQQATAAVRPKRTAVVVKPRAQRRRRVRFATAATT